MALSHNGISIPNDSVVHLNDHFVGTNIRERPIGTVGEIKGQLDNSKISNFVTSRSLSFMGFALF